MVYFKTGKRASRKDKFLNFVLGKISQDVSSKELARRKRAKAEYHRYIMRHKITNQEIRAWARTLPKRKHEIFALTAGTLGTIPLAVLLSEAPKYVVSTPIASSILGGGAELLVESGVPATLGPIASVIGPFTAPLLAAGIGTALAYDLWHLKSASAIRTRLKKLGKWTDHEIDWIVAHIRHHKKQNPRLLHGVRKQHMKRLEKVM